MRRPLSFRATQIIGTSNKVTSVENNTPKASVTAIGRIFSAWEPCSVIKGSKPIKVVNEVRNIGRKRAFPARIAAS